MVQARARLYAKIREYFSARKVLEVETPIINRCTVTDPHIDSIGITCGGQRQFLHTSPEYAMKRLLVSLGCDAYQLCKVFRAGESGRFHHTEFTMLEWYRMGWSYRDLMQEVDDLVRQALDGGPALHESEFIRYQEAFLQYCALDPWSAGLEDYRSACRQAGIVPSVQWSCDACQALLLDQVIAAHLPKDRMTFVYDFPAQHSGLARINNQGRSERFEVYVGSLELANGYQELTDADKQRKRFDADNEKRRQEGKEVLESDESLIRALKKGLPECAGVALGIDRLLMLITDVDDIREVLACPD